VVNDASELKEGRSTALIMAGQHMDYVTSSDHSCSGWKAKYLSSAPKIEVLDFDIAKLMDYYQSYGVDCLVTLVPRKI
jgi:hypothetical protein